MADNVEVTAGSGTAIAADDISSVWFQRVKIAVGADGAHDGDLDYGAAASAASIPVVIANDQDFVKAEDAGHSSGDKGIMALAVRTDTMASLAGTTADYAPLQLDANGQARVLAGSPDIVVTVTPTLDTLAYGAGDLLFDSTEVAAAVRVNGGTTTLQSIHITDIDDQKTAFTLIIANAATDFGTLNSAPDPDDTEILTVIGKVNIVAGDYIDMGANSVATVSNIGLMLKAGAATTSLYIAGVNGTGTPTHTAAGLGITLGFMRS